MKWREARVQTRDAHHDARMIRKDENVYSVEVSFVLMMKTADGFTMCELHYEGTAVPKAKAGK